MESERHEETENGRGGETATVLSSLFPVSRGNGVSASLAIEGGLKYASSKTWK
ncbi:hypothetical protein BH20ACI3_BH20ACI3_11270 [soil metagenome]